MNRMIENDCTRLEWNEEGELVGFINRKTNRSIAKRHRMFRLILQTPECLECEAVPSGGCTVRTGGGRAEFCFPQVADEHGTVYPIACTLSARLDGEDVHWGFALENNTSDATVRECHYPVISIAEPEPPMAAATSECVSLHIPNLPDFLRRCATGYMAPDQKYIRHSGIYPGRACSVNFFFLDWGTDGFYFGCHDDSFKMTVHSFELEKRKEVNCFMARLPFAKPGEKWHENCIIASPCCGNWMHGAAKYRAWADSWFKPPVMPPQIHNTFGWQRVIMHHQYGEYFFRYDDLIRILNAGKKAGIDTIFLFGWTLEGMDSGYPAYTPDPSCGGLESLKKNIRRVHENGGHVILYFNGQLIDAASDYYRNGGGQHVSIKRADGTEHREFYNFSNTGTFTREFGNKTFAVACPSCREWIGILKRHIDLAAEAGADSVFFDQLGLASYPCCDPSHGHEVPFSGLMDAKRELLRELYEYTKSKDPDMGLGVECPTDQTAQYCDFIHIFGNTAQSWNPGWRERGELSQQLSAACLFSAAFPEIYLSDREIRDDSDIEFRVNRLVTLGRRSDVEIYRCRANISETPHYQEYLGKVNRLRERFREILMHGKFSASKFHSVDHPLVLTNSFRSGKELAVIVTQSSRDSVKTKVSVPGWSPVDSGSVRDDVTVDGDTVTIPRDGLAVLLYRKDI